VKLSRAAIVSTKLPKTRRRERGMRLKKIKGGGKKKKKKNGVRNNCWFCVRLAPHAGGGKNGRGGSKSFTSGPEGKKRITKTKPYECGGR